MISENNWDDQKPIGGWSKNEIEYSLDQQQHMLHHLIKVNKMTKIILKGIMPIKK